MMGRDLAMADCIILMGLQGSGKTTFCRERFASHAVVSGDLMPSARRKADRVRAEVERALDAGRSVVVDNTSPTAAVRAPLIQAARDRGARVIGYFLEVATGEALARNRRREGRARVPDVAIFATARRLERPSRAEGFDALYLVRSADGAFELAPWPEAAEAR
jgi:predicted kinase